MHKMEPSIRQARVPSASLKGSVEADIATATTILGTALLTPKPVIIYSLSRIGG